MKREEAHTLLEVMAIELTGELANSERPVTERTKLLGKQLKAIDMAIEALQGDMYCPNCGVRLVQEDEYVEPTQTHGRLIDADALLDKLPKEYLGSTIHLLINDAPTIQADRPHGEWILECDSEGEGDNLYRCSKCGCKYGCQEYDKPNFCLECGARMTKGGDSE